MCEISREAQQFADKTLYTMCDVHFSASKLCNNQIVCVWLPLAGGACISVCSSVDQLTSEVVVEPPQPTTRITYCLETESDKHTLVFVV